MVIQQALTVHISVMVFFPNPGTKLAPKKKVTIFEVVAS